MTQELWLPISGFPNYEVSSLGRVRRTTTNTSGKAGRILVGYRDKDGYHCVLLYANGKRKIKKVHRLVVEAFVSEIPEGMHVNHKNGVKDENRAENLEIVTPAENAMHGYRVLGRPPSIYEHAKGTSHVNSRFTDNDIRQIRLLYSEGLTQKKLPRYSIPGKTT